MAGAPLLPSGVVSFVMTDIEGSTTLLRALGSGYPDALERHRTILRGVWAEHGGVEVDAEGDSFLVAFAQPRDAVAACADALRRVQSEEWGPMPLRIRVGAHLGPAKPHRGRYAALAVHQTARIVDAANGDQVLLSATIVQQARRALHYGAGGDGETLHTPHVVDLGRYRIRDFDEPIELYALRPAGVAVATAPPRAKPAESNNLPNPSTELIGRRNEVHRLDDVVQPGRIVTLLGPGGVGKTKVAIEFARHSLSRWPDGAWLVPLAPLSDERSVLEAVAKSLTISLSGSTDPRQRLLAALRERHCLLVLDNCEQVRLAAGRVVGSIRRTCASVAIVTTSRVPLGLSGEQIVRVAPLHSGANSDGPAVQLFEARANDIDATNAWPRDVVAALCDRLDGLPLAIELAAARTDAVRPTEILAMVDHHDSLLQSDDPTAETRHRSLNATIDWSYDLLSPSERATLRRLTVFDADFDLDDAVAAATEDGLVAGEVAADVWTLVANSMLARIDRAGSSRYVMLSTVRHHIASIADADELADAVRRAASSLDERTGPHNALDAEWLHRAELELENTRGFIARSDVLADQQRMRLLWTIGRVHDVADRYSVGLAELRDAIADVGPSPELVGVMIALADLHLRFGDTERAEELIERASGFADEVGEPAWECGGIARIRADIATRRGQYSIAEAWIEGALDDAPSPRTEAYLWSTRGFVRKGTGDLVGAISAFERARDVWVSARTQTLLAKAHSDLAGAFAQAGEFDHAVTAQLEALAFAERFRQPSLIAFSAAMAGRISARSGDWETAVELITAAEMSLAEVHVVPYASDREPQVDLLERANQLLGAESVREAQRRGEGFDHDEVLTLTRRILAAADRAGSTGVTGVPS